MNVPRSSGFWMKRLCEIDKETPPFPMKAVLCFYALSRRCLASIRDYYNIIDLEIAYEVQHCITGATQSKKVCY
jgi:hypothetical protein